MPGGKKGSLVAKPKPIFKNCVISIAGSLQYTESQLNQWISMRGGKFSPAIDESVTHLLATKAQFIDKKNSHVAKAKSNRRVKIVTPDWLEDSMVKNSKLPDDDKTYSLRKISAEKAERARKEKVIEKSKEQDETYVNETLNKIYTDETFFKYQVALDRPDPHTGKPLERYVLSLFESIGAPKLYRAAVLYRSKPRKQWSEHSFSETPGPFIREFDLFKRHFRSKTGYHWDQRMEMAEKPISGKFHYKPPTRGKPVGLVRGQPWVPSIFGNGQVNLKAEASATDQSPLQDVTEHEPTVEEQVQTTLKQAIGGLGALQ